MTSPRDEVAPYEALPVQIVLKNTGSSAFRSEVPLDFTAYAANPVRVTRPDGSTLEILQANLLLEEVLLKDGGAFTLGPGESRSLDFELSYDWDHMRPVLDQVGSYELVFAFRGGGEEVASAPLRVQVEAPMGAASDARRFVEEMEHPEVLVAPGLLMLPAWKDALEDVEQLAESYGETLYGHYANLSLAEREVLLAQVALDADDRKAHLGQAARYLEALSGVSFTRSERVRELGEKVRELQSQRPQAGPAPRPPPSPEQEERNRLKREEARRVALLAAREGAPIAPSGAAGAAPDVETPPSSPPEDTTEPPSPPAEPRSSRVSWTVLLVGGAAVLAGVIALLLWRS